jgi:hypothetical protein
MDPPVPLKSQDAELVFSRQAPPSQTRLQHLQKVRQRFIETTDHHLPSPPHRQARWQTYRCLPRRTRSMPQMRPSHADPGGPGQGQTLCEERKRILHQQSTLSRGPAVSSRPKVSAFFLLPSLPLAVGGGIAPPSDRLRGRRPQVSQQHAANPNHPQIMRKSPNINDDANAPNITAVSLTVASGVAYAGAGVSPGADKRPLTKARVPGRPKGGAFLVFGCPEVSSPSGRKVADPR